MADKGTSSNLRRGNLFIVAFTFAALFSYFFAIQSNVLPQAVAGLVNINILQASFTLVTAISLIVTSFEINKHNHVKTIATSSLVTTIFVALIIPTVPWNDAKILLVFLTGISFSIGAIGVLTYFWTHTQSQKRGRLGSLVALFTILLYSITTSVLAQTTDLVNSVIIAISPVILALIMILIYDRVQWQPVGFSGRNYYPEKRTVILYSVTWILFCFINGTISKNIDLPSPQMVSSQFVLLLVIQALSSVSGIFTGGEISDTFGRRPSLVLSVALYGLSMAFSGFSHDTNILFFAFGLEGFSWGILLTLYGFVIWGDLANKENCARMYALGLATYVAFLGIGQFPSFLTQISPATSALIGCSVIFLANLPIALAPELLTSEDRKTRKMQGYIRKVKKIAEDQN